MKLFAIGVMAVGVFLVTGCATRDAIRVTISNASLDTSGGNLFNCTTPAFPAHHQALSTTQIGCEPQPDGNGGYSTKPVVVWQQIGCDDGHGALVTVTCAGSGNGKTVVGTVTLSVTASCNDSTAGTDAAEFPYQDLAPAATQTSSSLSSCADFDDLCPTSNPCAYNAFSGTVAVANDSP